MEADGSPSAVEAPRARRRLLAENVYRELRELIISLRLSPGTPLAASELTDRLGVSRTPIRQALDRLQQEGFVVERRFKALARTVVAPVTVADMQELHDLLGVLEGLCARAAAKLPGTRRRRFAQRLRRANRKLRAAWTTDAGDVHAAQDHHVAYHRTFVEMAESQRLRAMLEALEAQVERYERVYAAGFGHQLEQALLEHEETAAAIAAGDPERAERAARENWHRASQRYVRIAESLGARGEW